MVTVDPGSGITHPGGPGSTHDAAIVDRPTGGSNGISGRVCLAADPRQLDVLRGQRRRRPDRDGRQRVRDDRR